MGRVAAARDQRVEAFRRGPDGPATRLQPWPSGFDGEEALGRALAVADVALAAAEESHWHVLAVFEKTLGPNHPQVATMHRRLADLHQGMGRRARAETHLRTALGVRTAALGPRHPDTATDSAALGLFLAADGREAEAEPLLRDALATFRSAFGPDSPQVEVLAEALEALPLDGCLARAGGGELVSASFRGPGR
jgi:hypothetical protein